MRPTRALAQLLSLASSLSLAWSLSVLTAEIANAAVGCAPRRLAEAGPAGPAGRASRTARRPGFTFGQIEHTAWHCVKKGKRGLKRAGNRFYEAHKDGDC